MTPLTLLSLGKAQGGHNTALLLSSPQAQGLFERAIIFSAPFVDLSVDEAQNGSDHFINDATSVIRGVDKEQDASLDSLRQLPVDVLLKGTTSFSTAVFSPEVNFMDVALHGIRDGVTLPAAGMIPSIANNDAEDKPPVIIGGNRDEFRSFVGFDSRMTKTYFGMIPSVLEPTLFEVAVSYASRFWLIKGVYEPAEAYVKAGHETYVYRFEWDDNGIFLWLDISQFAGAAHSTGLPFVFNDFSIAPMADMLYPEDGREMQNILAQQMGGYMASFAHGRAMQTADGFSWPAYTNEKPSVLIFDTPNDGGLRISHETDTYERWLNDLKSDTSISIEQKCLVIDVMNGFARGQESEIRETVGCTAGS